MRGFLTLILTAVLFGCASVTPTQSTESAFVIFAVAPSELERTKVLDAVLTAVQRHTTQVQTSRNIPPTELPDQPGRVRLTNPMANTQLGALMAAQGQSLQVAVCDDALMTVVALDNSMARYGEQTRLTACVFQFSGGFHVDVYATYTQRTGAFSTATLGATVANALVGDSSQFIPRAMKEIRRALERVGGEVTVVDSYIPESFKGIFNDSGASLRQ